MYCVFVVCVDRSIRDILVIKITLNSNRSTITVSHISRMASDRNDDNQQPQWSPMMCLPKAPLTSSGLLQLDTTDGEVELIR